MAFTEPRFRTKIIPDFYPRANEMRQKYDDFFANAQQHNDRHQVWDMWFIESHYTYLRAQARHIVGDVLFNDFENHITKYARSIGLQGTTGSFLSIYVSGCHQTTHSDQLNGTYGWVFSLTHWASRTFTGGQTYVARAGAFDQLEPRDHRATTSYWECLEPHFGQLTLFDDRVAHMVPQITGTMDPLLARVVLHGHLI